MRVRTNVQSMSARRTLNKLTRDREKSSSKMASQDRIHQAAYDPAGLAISEKMRANIRSMGQAERNANQSISMLHVAESSLGIMGDLNNRLRELAIQSASDTVSTSERKIIDNEYGELKTEITRIAKITQYNSTKLLTGDRSSYDMHIGINNQSADKITYDMNDVLDQLDVDSTNVATKTSSRNSLATIDKTLTKINKARTKLGSINARVNSVINNLQISRESYESSKSRIRDVDVAKESANKAILDIRNDATTSLLAQTNVRVNSVMKLLE